MHGEVGVDVSQENDDDVNMADVAIHDADEEPGVNTEPMPTVNDVFRNTLADDTEDNDDISQLLRNVETGCLSERQLRKLEKMRKDGKTPLYKNCPMSKLEVNIMLLEFKSTNGLSDKGFDQLLDIIRKLLPEDNELLEKTYLAKQMICPIGLEVEKIHACSNDCILYHGEKYKDLDKCPKCEAPRYKEGMSDEGTKTRGPVKGRLVFPYSSPGAKAICMCKVNQAVALAWRRV
jgi:hypothetical protein